jgi:hypothetical protein
VNPEGIQLDQPPMKSARTKDNHNREGVEQICNELVKLPRAVTQRIKTSGGSTIR